MAVTTDPKETGLLDGRERHIRGIRSKIDDVLLAGVSWRANVTGAITAATLTRTIAGASTVEMTIDDPRGKLLTSPLLTERYDIELDGLHFRFVGVGKQDAFSLVLRHEDREVARLRTKSGPKKAFRDKLTRAEYVLALVRSVPGPPIPFFCPELHTKEPIATSPTGVRASASKVNSIPPTTSSEPTPGKVTGAVEVAASWYDLPGAGSCGDLQQNLDQAYAELGFGGGVGNAMGGLPCGKWLRLSRGGNSVLAKKCDTGSGGGGVGGKPRAVDVTRQVAEKLGLIAPGVGLITVEGLDPGTIVRGQGGESVTVGKGGAAVPAGTGAGSTPTSTTVTKTQRFAFERHPNETDWAAMVRLASEVHWDCFCANGVVYFSAETDLLASQVEMEVAPDAPGIDVITFDVDLGKPVTEVQITGRAGEWAAPPGCVAEVFDQGPADGLYIVADITNDLLSSSDAITATLKRPTKPLPEPAPQTTTKTISSPGAGGGGATGVGGGGASAMIQWAQSQVGTPEGAKEAAWARALGYDPSVPWCSIFIATGIKAVTNLPLPSNPAYSGTWEHWSGGRTVSIADRTAGDFLIFDWGDGGITDHISLNIGGGQMVGGNQAHGVGASGGGAVTREGIPVGNIVAVVRPNY